MRQDFVTFEDLCPWSLLKKCHVLDNKITISMAKNVIEPVERPFGLTQGHELVEWQMGVF